MTGHPRPALGEPDLRLAWQSASLLLGYPDDALVARVPLVAAAARRLPSSVAEPVTAFLDHLVSTPLPELATAYVETFDHQRRCCLYLTYCSTATRGAAAWRCCGSRRPTVPPAWS